MADQKLPALQFYTGDWRKDPCVQALDHEHKGVWIDLLCIMNETGERGRLVLPNGEPLPDDAIARNLGIAEAKWKQIRSKLLSLGVASEDEAGVQYNRRIVRDQAIRDARAKAGRKGGRSKKAKQTPSKTEAEGGSSVAVSVSSSASATTSTPPPRAAIAGADELAEWLGPDHVGSLDRFIAAGPANADAVASILATWARPSMTGEQVWGRLEPERRPSVLAQALEDFGGERQRYKARLFRAFVEARVADLTEGRSARRRSEGPGGAPGASRARQGTSRGGEGPRVHVET